MEVVVKARLGSDVSSSRNMDRYTVLYLMALRECVFNAGLNVVVDETFIFLSFIF